MKCLKFISENFTNRKPSQPAVQILNCCLLSFTFGPLSFLPLLFIICEDPKSHLFLKTIKLFPNRTVIHRRRFLPTFKCLWIPDIQAPFSQFHQGEFHGSRYVFFWMRKKGKSWMLAFCSQTSVSPSRIVWKSKTEVSMLISWAVKQRTSKAV